MRTVACPLCGYRTIAAADDDTLTCPRDCTIDEFLERFETVYTPPSHSTKSLGNLFEDEGEKPSLVLIDVDSDQWTLAMAERDAGRVYE